MAGTPRYPTVLFDLDGTLTDPFEGIARSICYALGQLGYPTPTNAELRSWIGPSLRGSFATIFGADSALTEQAMALYRERYGPTGIYENAVYAGISELLADLASGGSRVCLATGKPQIFAQRILEHFELARYFTFIGGASLDTSRESKADVIGYVLAELPAPARARAVMVGDREHDVFGARQHDLPTIGVAYGYGSRDELLAAGSLAIADTVAQLRALLFADS